MVTARQLVSESILLQEEMSFSELLAASEPKRILRSKTVRGPNLDIEAFDSSMYYWFNFKAFPSTEKKRHKGYIKFVKPRNPDTPLERVQCVVDCDCKDYRYRWAWANKQRRASKVGSGSLNQSLNRAPRITNPTARPGLCKHLITLRDYIYGQDSRFVPSDEPEDSERLRKLTAVAHVTVGSDGRPVSDRERILNQRAATRRRGDDPDAEVVPAPEPPPNPTNRNPQNECLMPAGGRVVSSMDSAERTNVLSEMVAQEQSPELPKDEQALQALKGMERLLGELVSLQRAEAAPVEPPTDEPPVDEPPAKDFEQPAEELELPAPPKVVDDEDEQA